MVKDSTKNDESHANTSRPLRSTSRFSSNLLALGGAFAFITVASKIAMENVTVLVLTDEFLTSLQETKQHLSNNVFLDGNSAPVAEEHRGVELEVVEGALPPDLDGLFVRNGPNPIPGQITKRYHSFDGHGMLHNVRFLSHPQPRAVYSNQFIPTPRYEIEKKMGKEIFTHVAEFTGVVGLMKVLLMNTGLPRAFGIKPLAIGQANTNVLMFDNKFFCTHEASLPFEIQLDYDGSIAKAVGSYDFSGRLDFPMSAHARKDHVTGNLLFHGYSGDPALWKKHGPIKVGEYDATSDKLLYDFGVLPHAKYNSFAHDLFFTKNWMVVYDGSVIFDVTKIFEPDASFFTLNPAYPMRFGLIPRSVGVHGENRTLTHQDVVWIDTGAAHALIHVLTAWEEDDGTVVVWAPTSDNFDGNFFNIDDNAFRMTEFRLNPTTGRLLSTKVVDSRYQLEFSRVRDDCFGRFCRFGYAALIAQENKTLPFFSGFTVWDMEKGALHNVVHFPSGEMGQEPVIIPKPGRDESNAVYLGQFLYNNNENQSYFALYDGEDENKLVVKLRVPHRVPFGFHGQWITGDELQSHINYHTAKSESKK